MRLTRLVEDCLKSVADFVWPTYRPECHYMRGPGPACLRRSARHGQPAH